jgi:hypothetical protein
MITEPPASLLDKARAVATGVGNLQRAFAGAHHVAHQAEVREALTRTELTVALHESLCQRADLQARLRSEAVRTHSLTFPLRPRRHNRLSQVLDRLLARAGALGQAVVIDRSGVMRAAHGSGKMPAVFDPAWYLATNPDVARRGIPPLMHYLIAGGREGRSAGLLFDDDYYRSHHADALAATSLTPLEHYLRVGAAGAHSPHALFDTPHYLAQGPSLAHGEDPVSHYIREGGAQGLSPHPMFDPAWYLAQAPDAVGQPALVHYLTTGCRKGHSPHPLFDTAWYLGRWPDVAETGLPPLLHFMELGGFEGRSPSPWFDLAHYVEQRGAALPPGVNPVVDYLQGGAWAINEARVGFPTAAYIAARPDLVRAGITPLEHWARRAGR